MTVSRVENDFKSLSLGEMLLNVRLHGGKDRLRRTSPFSEDIKALNTILFDSKVTRMNKVAAYRNWIKSNQPCTFGRSAATSKSLYVALIYESDILNMKRGDEDVRETIWDHRKVWKRYALHGMNSSFVICLVSRFLAEVEPGIELKEVCRRFMELYLDAEVDDDQILTENEYLYLGTSVPQSEKISFVKFYTLPNIFCSQADKRWWHDHRAPGGIMITSNALGHYLHSGITSHNISQNDKNSALRDAMLTINNAHKGVFGRKKLRDMPATYLLERKKGEESPFPDVNPLSSKSPHTYGGHFHTDYLIPSSFFKAEREQANPPSLDLDFGYIWENSASDHADLVGGKEALWFDVKKEVYRNDNEDLSKKASFHFDKQEQLQAYVWTEARLRDRLELYSRHS